jgi:hypothetical protein
MRLKLDAAVIKNKSGLGIRAGSFLPELSSPFSEVPPEAGRVNAPLVNQKRKYRHET